MPSTNWHESYPKQPRTDAPKQLRKQTAARLLLAYPPRLNMWEAHHLEYWADHGIEWHYLVNLHNVYATRRGIVFCLLGGGGWQLRLTAPGETRRFESAQGESRSAFFVPILTENDGARDKHTVFILEGPADAVSVRSYGYLAMATLGSAITDERVAAMHPLWADDDVYYIMDSDRAGWTGYDRFQKLTGGRAKAARLPGSAKDFCSVPVEHRQSLLKFWTGR